jgi:hypothetical protein
LPRIRSGYALQIARRAAAFKMTICALPTFVSAIVMVRHRS